MTIDVLNASEAPAPAVLQPAASPAQRALLEWAAANPTDRPIPDRAANGRYKLPDPESGKAKTRTRATTWASTLEDSAGLTTWRNRLLVAGLATSPDLVKAAAQAAADSDNKALSTCAGTALHVAGEKLAADVGTALHTAVEHWLMNGPPPPAPWDADVIAFEACLGAHGLSVSMDHVERIMLTPDLDVAGTADFILRRPDGTLAIGDLKTGSSGERLSYAIQLAIYAHATHLWRLDGTGYEDMPPVDQDVAYVLHMPAGTGACELVEVDIAKGWELAQLCGAVRDARKTKNLFTARPTPALPRTRSGWISDRLATLKESTAARALVRQGWPSGIDPKPAGGWSDAEVDQIDALLTEVESRVEAPFPDKDPAAPPAPTLAEREEAAVQAAEANRALHAATLVPDWDTPPDGDLVDNDETQALHTRAAALPADRTARAALWARDARLHDRPWGAVVDGQMTARCYFINLAALRCVTDLWDDTRSDHEALIRAAVTHSTGLPTSPTWLTGALLGALTIDQATRLEETAAAFAAGDPTTTAALAEVLTRAA